MGKLTTDEIIFTLEALKLQLQGARTPSARRRILAEVKHWRALLDAATRTGSDPAAIRVQDAHIQQV
jgi:hypothetical protein